MTYFCQRNANLTHRRKNCGSLVLKGSKLESISALEMFYCTTWKCQKEWRQKGGLYTAVLLEKWSESITAYQNLQQNLMWTDTNCQESLTLVLTLLKWEKGERFRNWRKVLHWNIRYCNIMNFILHYSLFKADNFITLFFSRMFMILLYIWSIISQMFILKMPSNGFNTKFTNS